MICQSPKFDDGTLENTRCNVVKIPNAEIPVNGSKINTEAFDFSIGFDLDGVDEFESATSVPWLEATSRLYVKPDPTLSHFDGGSRIKVLESLDSPLEIKGEDLDSGMLVCMRNFAESYIKPPNLLNYPDDKTLYR